MIPPRAEFVLISALLAFGLATLGCLFAIHGDRFGAWDQQFDIVLYQVALPAAVAAVLGAAYTLVSHARARLTGQRWAVGGMNLRMVFVSAAILPFASGLGLAVVELVSDIPHPSLGDAGYVLMIGIMVGMPAAIIGLIPAFILEYFVCYRYLQRTGDINTGSA